jgi:hypothetical protein
MRIILLISAIVGFNACVVSGNNPKPIAAKIEVIDAELASLKDRFGSIQKKNCFIPTFPRTGYTSGQKQMAPGFISKNPGLLDQRQEVVNWVRMDCCWIKAGGLFFVSMVIDE